MPRERDPAFAPGTQLGKLTALAMSLGSDHREPLTKEHCTLYAEYLLRKPIEYFENRIVKVRIDHTVSTLIFQA